MVASATELPTGCRIPGLCAAAPALAPTVLAEAVPGSRRSTAVDTAIAECAGVSPSAKNLAVSATKPSAAFVAAFPGAGSGSDGLAELPAAAEFWPLPFELERAVFLALGAGGAFARADEGPGPAKLCIAAGWLPRTPEPGSFPAG
jgi:hypothetical protein